MNNLASFFSEPAGVVSTPDLVRSLILSALCAVILAWFYNRYGKSLSNRERFSANFLLITITTTLMNILA